MQNFSEVYGIDESMDLLTKIMNEEGPFDGFLAFSQVSSRQIVTMLIQNNSKYFLPRCFAIRQSFPSQEDTKIFPKPHMWYSQGAILGCAMIGLQEKVLNSIILSLLDLLYA